MARRKKPPLVDTQATSIVARVKAARECAGCSLEDVAAIVDTSRFTYFKWESGKLTVTATATSTKMRLRALERALVMGRDSMLLPEPDAQKRLSILSSLVDAFALKVA